MGDDRFKDEVYIVAQPDGKGGWWSPLRAADGSVDIYRDMWIANIICRAMRDQGYDARVLTFDLRHETPNVN